ncbi:MAG: putative addiction module antidote protein [Alcanivoracaceae bacterium]|nr:putative addiction module antidote protein [Alcanivoracaceae bacterium]
MTKAASNKYGVKPFDIAEHLDNEAVIAEYLTSILADGDQDELLEAISQVARARGMADLAREAGLGRESLYKALRPGSQPRFHTVVKVLHALGVDLQAVPTIKAH